MSIANGLLMVANSMKLISVEQTYATASEVNLTVYTFPNINIGTPSMNRYIFVSFSGRMVAGATESSITFDGTPMVKVGGVISTRGVVMYRTASPIPTGTTGTVVVNLTSFGDQVCVSVQAVHNFRPNKSNPVSVLTTYPLAFGSMAAPSRGALLACAYCEANSSVAWTNMDELSDQGINGSTLAVASAYDRVSQARTATPANNINPQGILIAME